ncbi:MAG: DUF2384 domain-containing protein [Xanthomonadaceae bacterium]|nr:DUF2384 domain-containing protein [Xanthomonadaceae bacterium]MDE1959362.1 DUF2384 domain-containing protein [Xanthomonadaceae bacterium]MDE2179005.1 DUF2384 domain-containing protein [Xanthomonadaceae bacterium]MDE2245888.1 DUF2384 domain-containing protein [Xanthomonadaceae bacterium]
MSRPDKMPYPAWSSSTRPAAKKVARNVAKPARKDAKKTSPKKVAKKVAQRPTAKKILRTTATAAGSHARDGILRLHRMPGYEVAGAVRDGIIPAEMQALIDQGYSRGDVVRVIGPRSTIERKLRDDVRLDPQESDRLARMVRVIGQAEQVFGNPDKARHWMQRPSSRLPGGESPLSLLDTDSGTQVVTERLMQIQYGIFA